MLATNLPTNKIGQSNSRVLFRQTNVYFESPTHFRLPHGNFSSKKGATVKFKFLIIFSPDINFDKGIKK